MSRRDFHNSIKVSRGISPAAAETGTTALVSQILDTANFYANEFVGNIGSLADVDATFTVLMEEGDVANLSDAAAVADADLLGTEAGAVPLFSDDNKTFKLGYKGTKRYIRVTITPAANSGDVYISGVWLQSASRTGLQTAQKV